MHYFAAVSVIVALAGLSVAAPMQGRKLGCSVAKLSPDLSTNQTLLSVPAGQAPEYIALGVGTQNYTCSAAGAWVSAGALADMYDVSCIAHASPTILDKLPSFALSLESKLPASVIASIDKLIDHPPFELGVHYFIPAASGTGLSPKWDFASSQGNPDDYVVAAKVGDLPAPTGTGDVDWLELSGKSGDLANTVFRINTAGGTASGSCTPGAPLLAVEYTAIYWFFA